MGKPDEYYYDYLDDNNRFADQVNGALFQGKQVVKPDYNNIDSDTRELLAVVANVKIPEEYKVIKNGEERYEMCKAFEDYRLEGKIEGRIEGKIEGRKEGIIEGKLEGMQELLIQMTCKKLMKNKSAAEIADELEQELPEIERIIAAQQRVGSYDVGMICEALAGQG